MRFLAICFIYALGPAAAFSAVATQCLGQDTVYYGLHDFAMNTGFFDPEMPIAKEVEIHLDPSVLARNERLRNWKPPRLPIGEAASLLSTYQCLATIFIDKERDLARANVLLRDASRIKPKAMTAVLNNALERASNLSVAFVVQNAANKEWSQSAIKDIDALDKEWNSALDGGTVRFLAFDGAVVVSMGAREPGPQRAKVISGFLAPIDALTSQMQTNGITEQSASKFNRLNQTLYGSLKADGLMNDRLTYYEMAWAYGLRKPLAAAPDSKSTMLQLVSYNVNFQLAQAGNTVTVVVGSSKGSGAEVLFNTPAKAQQGIWRSFGSPTQAMKELPKNDYSFMLCRDGTEAGRKDNVPCNADVESVVVTEVKTGTKCPLNK